MVPSIITESLPEVLLGCFLDNRLEEEMAVHLVEEIAAGAEDLGSSRNKGLVDLLLRQGGSNAGNGEDHHSRSGNSSTSQKRTFCHPLICSGVYHILSKNHGCFLPYPGRCGMHTRKRPPGHPCHIEKLRL